MKEKRVVVNKRRTPGVLSTDLAHIREADFVQLFKERGKAYMWGKGHHDRYFLNSVELHTGYLVSDILYGKAIEYVKPKLVGLVRMRTMVRSK